MIRNSNSFYVLCVRSFEVAFLCIRQKPDSSNLLERASFLSLTGSPEVARGKPSNPQPQVSPSLIFCFLPRGHKVAAHSQSPIQTERKGGRKKGTPAYTAKSFPQTPSQFLPMSPWGDWDTVAGYTATSNRIRSVSVGQKGERT